MKMIAGFSVVLAATAMQAAAPQQPVENFSSVFNGNSYVSADDKIHGNIDLFKTFAHDSNNTALNFIGLSNANIFVGHKLGENAKIQFNTQYGPINVVDPAASADNTFKVTEAFVTYAVKNVQVKLGQFFSAFGDFNPYRADKSLTEARLSKLNNNAAEIAYAINPSSYAKVWAVKPSSDASKEYFGGKVGYKFAAKGANVAADFSMLNDAREMFEAPATVVLDKGNAFQGQVSVNYGQLTVAGKMLRAPKLISGQTETPVIKGITVAYDTPFSGHPVKLTAEWEKAKNMSALELPSKRLGLFASTPLDKKVSIIVGTSERTIDTRKLRTTSFGLKATL